MRVFEVVMIATLLLAVAARWHRRTRGPKAAAFMASAAIFAVSMHVWFEGGRWQMIPAYVLAGLLFVTAGAGPPRSRRGWRSG